ncbi:hypothetical protein KKD37_02925 [Patescibacteria group bacterium]|nr:hypothetical protein [Patescibacteria group bacterium]
MTMEKLSEKRMAQIEMLEKHDWWNATDAAIRLKIAYLPEKKWDGAIEDLINRTDIVGGLEQKRIIRFETDAGQFGGLINFEVVNHHDGDKVQSYMYWTWRNGPASGAKGTVFVASNGVITHFVRLYAEKFAIGGEVVDDSIGGFGAVGEDSLTTWIRELTEELHTELKIIKVVDLGPVRTDSGLGNMMPNVFFAIVDGEGLDLSADSPLLDRPEVESKYTLAPIAEYPQFLRETDSGYALQVAGRMQGHGFSVSLT